VHFELHIFLFGLYKTLLCSLWSGIRIFVGLVVKKTLLQYELRHFVGIEVGVRAGLQCKEGLPAVDAQDGSLCYLCRSPAVLAARVEGTAAPAPC